MLTADDHFAITALIHRYCWLIDAGDFDGLGQLFARAEVHYSGGAVIAHDPAGLAALMRGFVRIHPETGTPQTRHACGNIIISAEAGGAPARFLRSWCFRRPKRCRCRRLLAPVTATGSCGRVMPGTLPSGG